MINKFEEGKMAAKKTVKKRKVAMVKKKIKILEIKDNKNKPLKVDINQYIWNEIEKNINNKCIKKGVANVRKGSNTIKIKKYPKVEDVCRYKIIKNNDDVFTLIPHSTSDYPCSNFCDMETNKYDKDNRDIDKEGVILLVLESPHKDEYSGCFNPIAPANGKTGDNIEKYIVDVLKKINDELIKINKQLDKKTYYLIISNPVPYQTSLNYFHKDGLHAPTRNKVWKKIWDEKNDKYITQKKFEIKINQYDPDLIINACTGGNNSKSLQAIISKWVIDGFSFCLIANNFSTKLVKTHHPSARNYNDNYNKRIKNNNNFGLKIYDKITNKWI